MTQAALAEAGGTSQPTIAAYEGGDRVPNLRTADRLAAAAGMEMIVDFGPPLTREDRRSLALHEAVAKKLQADPESLIEAAARTLGRMQWVHQNQIPILSHWYALLDLPVEHLIDVLLDPRPFARELRQCTPFAGVLTAGERAEVYRQFREDERRRTVVYGT